MDDIIKLRELISNGYIIEKINEDASGKCVVSFSFSTDGNPPEGQYYNLVTKDIAVIMKAREIFDR